MITQEMKDKGTHCRGKGFNCYNCKDKSECVEYEECSEIKLDESYENCKYCSGDVDMRDYILSNGNEGVYIDGNGNLVGDDDFDFEDKKINFCPICGRKL